MSYIEGEMITIGAHQVYFYRTERDEIAAEIRSGSEEIAEDLLTSYEVAGLMDLFKGEAI